MTDFASAFVVVTTYFLFVVIGSKVMKNDSIEAIKLPMTNFWYNISQIFLCGYMTIEAFLLAYRNGYSIVPCNEYNNVSPPIANLLWLFYISKIWDFWDTIFMVLGKRWKQLSFLHVYHHITIFLFYWLNANVYYDGDVYLTIVLNGFIHTVMYTYYFVSIHTKDPKTGKSIPIWWKPYMTSMQMVQFTCMMSQGTYLVATGCESSSLRITGTYVVYILSLFFLFAHFFKQSYMKPKKGGKKKD